MAAGHVGRSPEPGYKDFTQPDSSNLRTVTYCLSSGMLATSACGSNVATGTFYADDVPTGSCTYHRVTVPTTDPDTGATGGETGDNTDSGTTDPGYRSWDGYAAYHRSWDRSYHAP